MASMTRSIERSMLKAALKEKGVMKVNKVFARHWHKARKGIKSTFATYSKFRKLLKRLGKYKNRNRNKHTA